MIDSEENVKVLIALLACFSPLTSWKDLFMTSPEELRVLKAFFSQGSSSFLGSRTVKSLLVRDKTLKKYLDLDKLLFGFFFSMSNSRENKLPLLCINYIKCKSFCYPCS